jgi:hypothetical protein
VIEAKKVAGVREPSPASKRQGRANTPVQGLPAGPAGLARGRCRSSTNPPESRPTSPTASTPRRARARSSPSIDPICSPNGSPIPSFAKARRGGARRRAGQRRPPPPSSPACSSHAAADRGRRPLARPDHGDQQSRKSLKPQNRPRALIQMATGSGKTFTAISFIYRLIKFAGARRILFLVDRGNLGRPDEEGIPAIRLALQQLQVRRGIHRPAPARQQLDTTRASASAPSSACIPCSRAATCAEEDRRSIPPTSWRISLFGQPEPIEYNPSIPSRPSTSSSPTRPPLHLQPLGAGAGILRRLPHRPHRHARQADLRLLPPEPGDGIRPRAWPSPTASTSTTTSTASAPKSPRQGSKVEAGYWCRSRIATPARPRWGSSTTISSTTPTELDRDVSTPDQIRTIVRTFRDRWQTEIFPGRARKCPRPSSSPRTTTTPRTSCRSCARNSARATTSPRRSPTAPPATTPKEPHQGLPQPATTRASPSPST